MCCNIILDRVLSRYYISNENGPTGTVSVSHTNLIYKKWKYVKTSSVGWKWYKAPWGSWMEPICQKLKNSVKLQSKKHAGNMLFFGFWKNKEPPGGFVPKYTLWANF